MLESCELQNFKGWELLTALPLMKSFETVHHGAIVSIGGRCQDDKQQADIQSSHSLLLMPGNSRELLPRQLEGCFSVLEVHGDGRDGYNLCLRLGGIQNKALRISDCS